MCMFFTFLYNSSLQSEQLFNSFRFHIANTETYMQSGKKRFNEKKLYIHGCFCHSMTWKYVAIYSSIFNVLLFPTKSVYFCIA